MAKSKSSIASMLTKQSIQANTQKEKQRLDIKLENERNTDQVENILLTKLKIDPVYEGTIRPQKEDEALAFRRLIEQDGIRDALVVYELADDLYIVDGHHRFKAAKALNIERVPIKRMHFESQTDATQWMLRNQLGRRNLTDAERIDIALTLEGEIRKQAKANLSAGGKGLANLPKVDTRAEVAKISNTSARNVSKYKKVKDLGTKELVEDVLSGKKSIHKAYTEVQGAPVKKEEISTHTKVSFQIENDLLGLLQERAKAEGKKTEETIIAILEDVLLS